MCGIVGLHLRTPQLYPRLGALLTGMLCEMGDRGSDSAGVAVYGDPTWAPPGRGCVSVLEVEPTADAIGKAYRIEDAEGRYIEFVKRSLPKELDFQGIKIVVDCANGAAYKVAPTVLRELGAQGALHYHSHLNRSGSFSTYPLPHFHLSGTRQILEAYN